MSMMIMVPEEPMMMLLMIYRIYCGSCYDNQFAARCYSCNDVFKVFTIFIHRADPS